MTHSSNNPEKEKVLQIGSSTPKILQATFPEAMRLMFLFQNSGGKLVEEYDVPDFITPDTQYFKLDSIYSNEVIEGVKLTRDGHLLNVSDADYALYLGQARMNSPLRGKMFNRNDRFMLMQFYLDADTYRQARTEVDKDELH